MELNKEALSQLGLTDDQAERVIEAHKSELSGKFIPKARFDEVNNELKDAKKQVTERDDQIESLKDSAGSAEELQSKVKELTEANKKTRAEYETKLSTMRKTTAIRSKIADAYDADLTIGLLNLDGISIDGDKVLGLDDQLKTLRESKPYLFKDDSTEGEKGNGTKVSVKGKEPSTSVGAGFSFKDEKSAADYGRALAEKQNKNAEATKTSGDYYFGSNNK